MQTQNNRTSSKCDMFFLQLIQCCLLLKNKCDVAREEGKEKKERVGFCQPGCSPSSSTSSITWKRIASCMDAGARPIPGKLISLTYSTAREGYVVLPAVFGPHVVEPMSAHRNFHLYTRESQAHCEHVQVKQCPPNHRMLDQKTTECTEVRMERE